MDSNLDDFVVRRLAALVIGLAPLAAFTHTTGEVDQNDVERTLSILLFAALSLGAFLYARGVYRLWRRAGVGRGIRRGDSIRFALGWAALAGALLSPVDSLAAQSFAVHMIEHELLMVVAAPLIVLGRPLEAWTWAVSTPTQRFFAKAVSASIVRRIVRFATLSLVAWIFHALALWLWHLPALFQGALHSPWLHLVQHTCFFLSAIAYWWSIFGGRALHPQGSAIASLFTTMLHMSALGALLTFSQSPWYTRDAMRLFGLSAVEDQQLGGLIMWVPGGLPYLIASLLIIRRWVSPVSWRQDRLA